MNQQMLATSPLTLTYAFTPSVNPIRASSTDSKVPPNIIDLTVMITNTTVGFFAFEAIKITIPTGAAGDNLTTKPYNPPAADPQGLWSCAVSGSVVTITPKSTTSPATLAGGSVISFTLPGIKINEVHGSVKISITEIVSSTEKNENPPPLISLTKQAADFPISNFSAQPSVLTDLDQKVTLYWDCTPDGKSDFFGLRCDELEWQSPATCFAGGDCYQAADGTTGVLSPNIPIADAVTFYLDVGTTQGSDRIVLESIPTTVQVNMPSISPNSSLTQYFYTRQVVRLNWLAFNAARCTVELDGVVIDDDAPTDTYDTGYPVVAAGAGTHQISVIAHAAAPSKAQFPFTFPEISVRAPESVAVHAGTEAINAERGISLTPDGKLALVTGGGWGGVEVIDISTFQADAGTISVGTTPVAIAVTPNGTLALVANYSDNSVSVVDIASRRAEAQTIPVGSGPNAIAITPDGTLALVTANSGTVTVIDIASRTAAAQTIAVGRLASGIALTPDGKLALVVNSGDNNVSVIDVAGRQVEPQPIQVGNSPSSIAITPHGKYAFVSNIGDNTVTVIDIVGRVAEPTVIPFGLSLPTSVAITPDGLLALVSSDRDVSTVSVISVPARRPANQRIPTTQVVAGLVILGDGTQAFVVDTTNGSLTKL